MAFHVLGFFKNINGEEALTPIDDDVFAIKDTNYFVSSMENSIFAAYAVSANLTQAKVSFPTARQIDNPHVRPVDVASAVPNDPNLAEWLRNPLVVPAGESLHFEAKTSSAADAFGLVFLTRQLEPAPAGPVTTIGGSAFDTLTKGVWKAVSLGRGGNGVGPGRYAVIGAECVASSPVAFRLRFDDQGYRPGGLSQATVGGRTHEYFRVPGTLGVWGYFGAQVMPRLEILASANVSPAEYFNLYLQIVKVD